jgi:3-methyladenine DNA glycosylase AlkD
MTARSCLELVGGIKVFHTEESWPLYEELVATALRWNTLDWLASRIIGPLVLRDYSYTNPAWVEAFVREHRSRLSGLSCHEALKQLQRRADRQSPPASVVNIS